MVTIRKVDGDHIFCSVWRVHLPAFLASLNSKALFEKFSFKVGQPIIFQGSPFSIELAHPVGCIIYYTPNTVSWQGFIVSSPTQSRAPGTSAHPYASRCRARRTGTQGTLTVSGGETRSRAVWA